MSTDARKSTESQLGASLAASHKYPAKEHRSFTETTNIKHPVGLLTYFTKALKICLPCLLGLRAKYASFVFQKYEKQKQKTPHLLFTSKPKQVKQEKHEETSVVVLWLRLLAPNAGDLASIPGQGTRACTPQLRTGAA